MNLHVFSSCFGTLAVILFQIFALLLILQVALFYFILILFFSEDVYNDQCIRNKMMDANFTDKVSSSYAGVTSYSGLNSTIILNTALGFASCKKEFVSPSSDYLRFVPYQYKRTLSFIINV